MYLSCSPSLVYFHPTSAHRDLPRSSRFAPRILPSVGFVRVPHHPVPTCCTCCTCLRGCSNNGAIREHVVGHVCRNASHLPLGKPEVGGILGAFWGSLSLAFCAWDTLSSTSASSQRLIVSSHSSSLASIYQGQLERRKSIAPVPHRCEVHASCQRPMQRVFSVLQIDISSARTQLTPRSLGKSTCIP